MIRVLLAGFVGSLLLLVGCSSPVQVQRDIEGDEAGECSDGADNDQDGAFDCDDDGCVGSPVCDAPVEGDEAGECSDGADNDQDGAFDCDDDGCVGSPECAGDDDDSVVDDDDSVVDDDDSVADDDDSVVDDDDSVVDDDDSMADDDDSVVDDDDSVVDDDDSVADDDDSAGDDDDSTGDDDDSAGDDDDSAGDDDDSAGDDDDSAGDDDDSATTLPWAEVDPWILGFNVVDAEYVVLDDLVVAVSESPNSLHIIDPLTQVIDTVPLPVPPTAVSVSPDGTRAVVGHDGWLTEVDLWTSTVIQTITVSTHVLDVVVTDDRWAYAFPMTGQWERIRCLDLVTQLETTHTGLSVRAGSLAKLHPTQPAIYVANNGLSPSDFEKYSTSGGTAAYLWDSPYHGTYAFSGNIWIGEDGARLFARSGNVFWATVNQSTDMVYAGSLANAPPLLGWVVTSPTAGRAYVVSSANSTGLWVYDLAFLAYAGLETLPDMVVSAGGTTMTFSSNGRFVFASSDGDAVHVLVQAQLGSGMLHDWALTTLLTANLP